MADNEEAPALLPFPEEFHHEGVPVPNVQQPDNSEAEAALAHLKTLQEQEG